MKSDNLDRIIESVRNEPIDPAMVAEANARVRERVFTAAADPAVKTLHSCADFQDLMRAYLTKSLAESRVMLLEDHVHSCVECRRALAAARTGKVRTMPRPQTVQHELPRTMKWAAAAAVVAAVGLSSWGVIRMLPSAGARATVQSVSGILYAVSEQSSVPIFSGREIGEGQRIRTARNSTAMLRLSDGSIVEMNERAEISITKNGRGTTVRLDRGNVIVQAAKQKNGAFFVGTPDCLVTVHGTVFAVTRGVKGTRVSVAEGEVKVDEGGHSQLLHPGDQTATNPSIEKSAVHDEFAWSRNSTKYLALLGEASIIQKRLEQIPGPGLRYSSKLLDLVPNNTVVYAAIPNMGETLAEASRLFNERVQESEVLREWWAEHQPKGPHSLEDIVNRLRTFSSYLGDEVVLSITGTRRGKYEPPMLLAEVKRPGLKEFLEAQARELGSNGNAAFQFVESAESIPGKTTGTQLLMTIKDDVVAIGTADSVREFASSDRNRFEGTYFHRVIAESYQSGVGWLFCANLEHIVRNSVLNKEQDVENSPTGLQDVRYLIFERKETAGKIDNRVALNFRGNRRGFASWLGAPGAMGGLDFVSPNALVASAFVLRNPQSLLSELFNYANANNSKFTQNLEEFEKRSGISVLNDLAGPLGTDVAFAIDGPVFPVPSWEFAIEVYSPDRLQWTIDKLVADFNSHSSDTKLNLVKEDVGGRAFYTLTGTNMPLEAHYTFADSYFVAAATQGMLMRAIQNRQNGYTLARSDKFRALLPHDSYPSFSGLIYHNVGPLIGPIAEQLKSLHVVTPAQRASIDALQANNAPGLIFAYGEPNRIVISGTGPLFGLSLQSLAVPNIIANAMRGSEHLHHQPQ
jgi:ferric-dicitrate binding protein FerR (iron transport regulator)